MIKNIKAVIMGTLSVIICLIFAAEAYAAVTLSFNISGVVRYTARDIGAEIAGTLKVNSTGGTIEDEKFIGLTSALGLGSVDSYGVFTLAGTETNYSTQVVADDDTSFDVITDTIDIYVFVRNRGGRAFMPTVSFQEDSGLNATFNEYYFGSSDTNPISLIRQGYTAAQLNTQIDSLSLGTDYQSFTGKGSILHGEVYFAKITLSVDPDYDLTELNNTLSYWMEVNMMMDIQYITDESFLTVYQQNNIADPTWQKIGYNQSLSATAIKAETKSITALDNAYNANGNANLTAIKSGLTYDCDDYDNAIVYKDIDIVNVDIATGEIIGKLSDLDYPFEWYGGDVTLPSGTVLASGRELTSSETFTVDVYTYFPTMYVRRLVVNGYTYLSLTDEPYTHYGFVKIDAFYKATCEAVTYNPDKSIAYNSYGIITRSYLNGYTPLTDGSNAYCETNLGFTNNSGFDSRVDPRPAQMLSWSNNLTKQWQDYAANNPTLAPYTQESIVGCAGNDWHEFVYQILYLIKYANNNSQEMVGKGFSNASSPYSNAGNNKNYMAEKVGGTIGLRDTSKNSTNTANSGLVFNNQGMGYANNNVTPYYLPDFLTYNNGTKRILRDGYVGSNGYTSVSCLGIMNPWGDVWNWVCGVATINFNSKLTYCYVQLDDISFNSNSEITNYYVADDGSNLSTFNAKETALLNMGYIKLSYTIAPSDGYYRFLGTNTYTNSNPRINGLLSLIGLPDSTSSSGSTTTGLCDQLRTRSGTTTFIYGLGVGSNTQVSDGAGLFGFSTRNYAHHIWDDIGFRTKLVNTPAT